MSKKRRWTEENFKKAVKGSTSYRQVLAKIGLIEAGGNYEQVKKYIKEYELDTSHFRGMAWNKGLRGIGKPIIPMEKILVENSDFQSFKLKKRIIRRQIKTRML